MTNDTTAQATVLAKNDRIKAFNWLYGLVDDEGHERVNCLEEYVSDMEDHIDALTEQVRVLRECVEGYAELDDPGWRAAVRGDRARRALAALEKEVTK